LELLQFVDEKFEHPLKILILDAAKKMICNLELSVEEAIERMSIVKNFPGQYHALGILYFSCNDINGEMEKVYYTILKSWFKILLDSNK